jgi:endoglucanase
MTDASRVSRWALRRVVFAVVGLVALSIAVPQLARGTVAPTRAATTSNRALGLHVKGNHLVNSKGQTVRLLGFNNSGAEYACIESTSAGEGWGIFDVDTATDTSMPASYVAAMAKWSGANAVRISLNEQCWLGIAGVRSKYGGATYQHAIEAYVRELNSHGFAVILDLHNSAPGTERSVNQEPMPDAHSISFWHQVAKAFKANTSVVFDVFNEPFPDNQSVSKAAWKCWRDGGCRQTSQNGGQTYRAVGMNQLIKAVRSVGARNVVMAAGLNYASSLDEWLRYEPKDPDHELAASLHVYSFAGCSTVACYNGAPAKVARQVPLVIGEFGADLNPDGSASCAPSDSGKTRFDSSLLGWANSHHASWLAWTWNPWPGYCMDLVKTFAGHPTSPYGVRVRAALSAARQSHRA